MRGWALNWFCTRLESLPMQQLSQERAEYLGNSISSLSITSLESSGFVSLWPLSAHMRSHPRQHPLSLLILPAQVLQQNYLLQKCPGKKQSLVCFTAIREKRDCRGRTVGSKQRLVVVIQFCHTYAAWWKDLRLEVLFKIKIDTYSLLWVFIKAVPLVSIIGQTQQPLLLDS